jgi:hypothetical protein
VRDRKKILNQPLPFGSGKKTHAAEALEKAGVDVKGR